MEGTRHGGLIAAQMLDVAIRVQAIRHFAVSQMVSLFMPDRMMGLLGGRRGVGGCLAQVCSHDFKVWSALVLFHLQLS